MKPKHKVFVASIAISILGYLVSAFVGAVVNVLISLTSGYRDYSAFKESENYYGMILIILFTLINHVFFSWLTVKLIAKYAKKKNYFRMSVFGISTVAILACLAAMIFLDSFPGELTMLTHIAGILLFGWISIKRHEHAKNNEKSATNTMVLSVKQTIEEDDLKKTGFEPKMNNDSMVDGFKTNTFPPIRYCMKCGFELIPGSAFCSKCGKKIQQ